MIDGLSDIERFSVLIPSLQIFLLIEFGLLVWFENTKHRKMNHFDPFWTLYALEILL